MPDEKTLEEKHADLSQKFVDLHAWVGRQAAGIEKLEADVKAHEETIAALLKHSSVPRSR